MFRTTILLSLVGALGLALTPSDAEACKCIPPSVSASYNSADYSMQVRITSRRTTAQYVYYRATVVDDFKGCDTGARVWIRTTKDSASCGIALGSGTYLVQGYDAGQYRGAQAIHTGTCDYTREWASVTADDLQFLSTRYNTCEQVCNDGTQPVNCFADPCSVSSCPVEGATCQANYCGGCNAEWYGAYGQEILECSPPPAACGSDADCTADTWCRNTESNTSTECVPYVGVGQSCEGYVLPWFFERCEPGLTCIYSEPTHDVPGTCHS